MERITALDKAHRDQVAELIERIPCTACNCVVDDEEDDYQACQVCSTRCHQDCLEANGVQSEDHKWTCLHCLPEFVSVGDDDPSSSTHDSSSDSSSDDEEERDSSSSDKPTDEVRAAPRVVV